MDSRNFFQIFSKNIKSKVQYSIGLLFSEDVLQDMKDIVKGQSDFYLLFIK